MTYNEKVKLLRRNINEKIGDEIVGVYHSAYGWYIRSYSGYDIFIGLTISDALHEWRWRYCR